MGRMVKSKSKLASKIFGTEGNMQGSKKVPMKDNTEYGTGAKYKKPSPPMAKKKSISKGR